MKRLAHCLSLFILLSGPYAFGQSTIGDATREVDKSIRKEIEKKLKPLPQKAPTIIEKEKEPEKEALRFPVKEIILTGYESISADELKPLIEPYEHRRVSLDELNTLAKEIKKLYLQKGIIATCIIPPQSLENQNVTLVIIEAKLGAIEVNDHRYFSKKRLLSYWSIPKGNILRYDKMSRSLHFMNKNPDRDVKATLHAGSVPKTTDVLLEAITRRPYHFSSGFDNGGTAFTGTKKVSFGARHNNFLGLDDSLLIGDTFGEDFNGLYFYHLLPINSRGTTLMYGFSYSKSFPKKEFTAFRIDSRAKNYSLFVRHDLFKEASFWGQAYVGIDANDKITRSNGAALNRDRLRIIRAGFYTMKQNIGSTLYVDSELSQGINFFGAKRRSALSSRGAGNTFTKLNASLNYKKALMRNFQGNVNIKNQWAFSKLAPQEELSLGGIDSVRGYPNGDYLADTGIIANLELLLPSFFIPKEIKLPFEEKTLAQSITAIVFFDYAYGRKRFASSTEKGSANLLGAGCGIRIHLFKNTLLRLEWGFPLHDKTITEQGNSRFHFGVDFEI